MKTGRQPQTARPSSHSQPFFHLPSIIVSLLVVAFVVFLAYRLIVELNYKWNWSAIPSYLFQYDQESGRWSANMLMKGLLTTLRLSVWSTLLASLLGTLVGLARTSNGLFNRMVSRVYVELMRNTPPLVIIFIFYFFFSDQLMRAVGLEKLIASLSPEQQTWFSIFFIEVRHANAFFAALATLAIFEGAYIAEIVRAGIQAIPRGQWEAARALGFNRWQQMRWIVFPQAMRQILPPLAGQFIALIKDSSIVSVISIQELTFMGTELMSSTYLTIEIWIVVTLLYLVMTLPCSLLVRRLEIYLSR